MITVIVSMYFGASLVSSLMLLAACMLAGRTQAAGEEELLQVTLESLQSIAEVDLPKFSQRRKSMPAHAGT